MMTEEQKKQIDNMSYREMLHSWRFAKLGQEPLHQGEAGNYFKKVMDDKRAKITAKEHTAISKSIGW